MASLLVTTGRLGYYEELRAQFPEGISTLLDIPGIGSKTAMLLFTELGIKTVDELEAAIIGCGGITTDSDAWSSSWLEPLLFREAQLYQPPRSS